MPSVLRSVLKVVAGLAVGLLLTEALFWWRDGGAFPHLHLYVPDEHLGVRLEPGATQRVSFGGNPVTRVRINREGLRGADLPPPSPGEVLVVGDSQVFGLGVEEEETFSARLDALLPGASVVNAGVPTYGPAEYTALLEELLPLRRPATVIFTVNVVNDFFEAERPNTERHVVWDGWAVRTETAPERVTPFPGRELLFRHSHAVFALRRVLHGGEVATAERGFSSEGTWKDVLGMAQSSQREHDEAEAATQEKERAFRKALVALNDERDTLERQLDETIVNGLWSLVDQEAQRGEDRNPEAELRASRGRPGDIVAATYGESSRSVRVTAELIRRGAALRARMEAALAAGRVPVDEDPEFHEQARELLGRRHAVEEELKTLRTSPAEVVRSQSPLLPWFQKVKALCDAHGARLVVLALPMDVQVSQDEWAKYGEPPLDMTESRILLDDIVATAERLGVSALDPTQALAAAEPGAFLNADIHLSPKGHRTVAEALARTLAQPPPSVVPRRSLPPGRSRVPTPEEWERQREITVTGSTRAGCETYQLREWLRVTCRQQSARSAPTGVRVASGGHGEAMPLAVRAFDAPALKDEKAFTSLVVPVLQGDVLLADFTWTDRTQRLEFHADPAKSRGFLAPQPPPSETPEPTPGAAAFCLCEDRKVARGCPDIYGAGWAECAQSFDDCEQRLACARGAVESRPRCPAGQANAGAAGHCRALCGPERPCDQGTCTPWEGGSVCL
ncbi:hypothetical protein [Comamonas sp. JC664]|uniref:alginate O-acetyltransferase AlgX-related protein n=1 Tax=Comamonas sp. JC664 TaxID=2801917 RepID=UPI00174DE98E|nr:hypothetical protein [Comamonas sp. JC664]MBL0698044.1 hypothetical protein [Comamonas sp. JC664]GHG71008.1 hypothetical protein GCM10012319_16460 [Comamonas sp. KCTC 72670]